MTLTFRTSTTPPPLKPQPTRSSTRCSQSPPPTQPTLHPPTLTQLSPALTRPRATPAASPTCSPTPTGSPAPSRPRPRLSRCTSRSRPTSSPVTHARTDSRLARLSSTLLTAEPRCLCLSTDQSIKVIRRTRHNSPAPSPPLDLIPTSVAPSFCCLSPLLVFAYDSRFLCCLSCRHHHHIAFASNPTKTCPPMAFTLGQHSACPLVPFLPVRSSFVFVTRHSPHTLVAFDRTTQRRCSAPRGGTTRGAVAKTTRQ